MARSTGRNVYPGRIPRQWNIVMPATITNSGSIL